ncbi:4-alpha-glucanotransferase [Anaerococcus vaginalis]|uniref:4-alpha-glucanotransferase n=2 Tax=Anaerococcus vaginalis TaxID=33037 RepID=C7HWG0_9FIRM|nr:4-alpha-glucanotransferase [Anaerococcus vaginalis]EEU11917.1 4-alpha-glucanotransferase [Anaerococcus vaginalis ATCC 51170]QQB61938.1 4-alpha-glucanotransferase [Anaerococcus vaginalis]
MKKAGILLPLQSLNGENGIGDFGKAAFDFIDIIKKSGFDMWQILPLNPLGYGNSPYQPYSSFAGDEIYISLDLLYEDGLLEKKAEKVEQKERIDYNFVRKFKEKYLKIAYENFKKTKENQTKAYEDFLKFDFVYNYGVFITLKKENNLRSWNEWPDEMKNWIVDKKFDLTPYEDKINYEIFVQYIFYKQWMNLKSYANENNIKIVGDIPFYVGLDSLDVWENQQYFEITKEGNPKLIAGVPPDNFSATGQRWGNPIYNWEKIKEDDFSFWINRLAYNGKLYDIVRLDHFRAFDTYWVIDSKNETAIEGEWLFAPGYELFEKIKKDLKDVEFIAEDLGEIRPEVFELRDYFNLKGMVIIQTDIRATEKNYIYAPENSICYTGTHDNKTIMDWFEDLSEEEKENINKLFQKIGIRNENIYDNFFEFAIRCDSEYVIIPLQDILGLGKEARINTPATLDEKNWSYKFKSMEKLKEKEEFLKEIIEKNRK